jgi:hypothetical protein
MNSIEPLEARIAPATIAGRALSYTDLDGDLVTVTFSTGTLTLSNPNGGNAGDNFQLTAPGALGGQILQHVDLTFGGFGGASITVTAKPQPIGGVMHGDGLVNIGSIDASGFDLGAVKIPGDLAQIFAGSGSDPKLGLKSLSVLSLGRFGMTTGAPGLAVNVDGKLGSLNVRGEVVEMLVLADSIGAVTIGGSILGKPGANATMTSTGDIGLVKIGGNADSGGIGTEIVKSTAGKLAGVSIGGTFVRGVIQSAGDMGLVTIRGDAGGTIKTITGKNRGRDGRPFLHRFLHPKRRRNGAGESERRSRGRCHQRRKARERDRGRRHAQRRRRHSGARRPRGGHIGGDAPAES